MVAELRDLWVDPTTDERGEGCSHLCRFIRAVPVNGNLTKQYLIHHAGSHENYGYQRALQETTNTVADVRTGPLLVRFDELQAYVGGEPVKLTVVEFRILTALALRLGKTTSHDGIIRAVWGDSYCGLRRGENSHLLRVNIARMRAKLGAARPLLETRPSIGYLLRAEPYSGPAL